MFGHLLRSTLGIAAVILSSSPAFAGVHFPARSAFRPIFVANAGAIPQGTDSVKVELHWEVPYRELAFKKDDRYFRARYDVTVVFLRDGRQVTGDIWERRVRVKSAAEARAREGKSTGRKEIMLARAKYEVRLTVTDRTSHASSEVVADLDAAFTANRIGLSDLRFVRYTEAGAEPNPSQELALGEEGHAVRLTLYPESETDGTYRVKWKYENARGEEIVARDTTLSVEGEPVVLEIPVPSDRLSPGLQRLDVRVEAEDRSQKERRKADLHARLTPRWFLENRKPALHVFEVIGSGAELEQLRDTPEERWEQGVSAFWARRDPTPSTDVNEFRDTIQSRMEAAASNFLEPFREGWLTDRGRILLQFGHPTRRTISGGSFDDPASELWEYDSPQRVFFFVDVRGSGEFWLRS